MSPQNSFRRFTCILLPVLSVGVFALPASSQTMTMLSGFNTTPIWSIPNAISNDGSMITGQQIQYGYSSAAKWMRDAGTQSYEISSFAGVNSYAEAHGVSNDGSVIVGENGYAGSFRWTASGGTQNLGSLPTGWQSAARGVSGDGLVVVGGGNIVDEYNQGWNRAYRWTAETGMNSIGSLHQWSHSNALGTNFDGSVIVGESYNQAFRWTSGSGMVGLGFLAGQSSSRARAICGDGSMIIGHSGQSGFQWTSEGGMQSLTGGWNCAYRPEALTADGSIIVGFGNPGINTAMIWANSNTAITLVEYLTAHSVSLAGWSHLTHAKGISADGRFIVGYGVYEGQNRGFVADIGMIPAPSAIALLGIAGIFGTRRRQ